MRQGGAAEEATAAPLAAAAVNTHGSVTAGRLGRGGAARTSTERSRPDALRPPRFRARGDRDAALLFRRGRCFFADSFRVTRGEAAAVAVLS